VSPPERWVDLFAFLLYDVIVDNSMATIKKDKKKILKNL